MTEVLLKELSSPDIDWIRTAGQDLEVEAGTILRAVNQPLETLYIVLEGTLTVSLSAVEHHPSTQTPTQEIARLTSGEMVGAIPLLEAFLPATTVRAVTPARVLAIPRSQLTQKVQDDLGFAAHLYRASALLLAQQLEQLLRLGDSTLRLGQLQRREAVTVFGELQDSDLDWFIAAGQVQQITADTVLNHRSRSIDALHILLDGALSLSAAPERNRVAALFSPDNGPPESEFARLSRGDMVGEMLFVEGTMPAITVRAVRDSQLLSIPRWRLAAKLLHDVGFAARFYRVLTVLLIHKQQAIVRQLGYGELRENESLDNSSQDSSSHSSSYSSFEASELSHTGESGNQFLTRVALAEARFEWMLKRIQMQLNTGGEIQW